MTVMEVAESPVVTTYVSEELDQPRQCRHVPPEREGLSGHEFSRVDVVRGKRRVPCAQKTSWRGIYSCGQDHLHVRLGCSDCKLFHDADAANGGLRLGWDKIDG